MSSRRIAGRESTYSREDLLVPAVTRYIKRVNIRGGTLLRQGLAVESRRGEAIALHGLQREGYSLGRRDCIERIVIGVLGHRDLSPAPIWECMCNGIAISR